MYYISTSQPITYTRDGAIPAVPVTADDGRQYWLVPKTRHLDDKSTVEPLVPVRDEQGRIVYALPGGGDYVPTKGDDNEMV